MNQNFNVSNHQPKLEANALECLANYNVSFGIQPVYAFCYDGTFEKYPKLKTIVEQDGRGVGLVLDGKILTSNGKTYAYAKDVERRDGSIRPEVIGKVMKNFQLAKNQPIYSIDYQGNLTRFDCRGTASSELGVKHANISGVLNGVDKIASGYMFVNAFDVEKRDAEFKLICDEDGNPVVDKKIINKARENFLYSQYNYPVARVGVDGDVTVFESVSDLEQKTRYGKNYIFTAIKSKQKCYGYAFIKLADVVAKDKNDNVLYNDDGTFMIDSEKVNASIQRVFKREVSN